LPTLALGSLLVFVSACSNSDTAALATTTNATTTTTTFPSTASTARPASHGSTAVEGPPSDPWIAYEHVASSGETLHLVHSDGSEDHALLPSEATASELNPKWNQLHPDWSPDGKRIVYGLGDNIDTKQLWIVNVDGTEARQLPIATETGTDVEAPRWSPDGRFIAYVRLNQPAGRDPFMDVQKIDVATGAVTTIFTPPPGVGTWWISWAPDGQRLAVDLVRYESPTSTSVVGSAVAIVDLTRPQPAAVAITPFSMFATYPDWSPRGDRIVFNTNDLVWRDTLHDKTVPSDLYTIRPDGSDLHQVTHNLHGTEVLPNDDRSGPLSAQPTWTPDATKIYFVQIGGIAPARFSMAEIAPDGSGLKSALSTGFVLVGTHPRLQP
jgi:Tol biopolymer transport system component